MMNNEYIQEERLKFYLKDEQIYKYYFGNIEIGRKYKSPLRHRDPNPSLVFRYYKNKLYWKDFGLIYDGIGDAVGFVQMLLTFENDRPVTRIEAAQHIFSELVENNKAPKSVKKLEEPLINFYDINYREINEYEMNFWRKLWLTRRELDKFNVKAVEGLFRNGEFLFSSTKEDPAYVYLSDDIDSFKTYRPYTKVKKDKFKGINNGGLIEGWNALPAFGDICLINSSLKDTMVNTKAGYPGCNPTSESSFETLLKKARELNVRFKKVIVFFDNDKPGIDAAKRLKKIIGWDYIYLPDNWGIKDPSDLVKADGNYFNLIRFLEKKVGTV